MTLTKPKLTTCLWCENQAAEAAKFYCSVFKNSKIGRTAYYPTAGEEIHGKPANTVLTVEFELEGMPFTALNAETQNKNNEKNTKQKPNKTQEKNNKNKKTQTTDGGEEGPCGWLKDKY